MWQIFWCHNLMLCAGMEPAFPEPTPAWVPCWFQLAVCPCALSFQRHHTGRPCKWHPGCLGVGHARFRFWFFSVSDQRELSVSKLIWKMGITVLVSRGCDNGFVKLQIWEVGKYSITGSLRLVSIEQTHSVGEFCALHAFRIHSCSGIYKLEGSQKLPNYWPLPSGFILSELTGHLQWCHAHSCGFLTFYACFSGVTEQTVKLKPT